MNFSENCGSALSSAPASPALDLQRRRRWQIALHAPSGTGLAVALKKINGWVAGRAALKRQHPFVRLCGRLRTTSPQALGQEADLPHRCPREHTTAPSFVTAHLYRGGSAR